MMTMTDLAHRTWRRRSTRKELALWLGWLLLVALFVFCWQVMTESTIWAFVTDAPRQAADIGSRMFPPRWEYVPALLEPLWDTLNIATLGTLLALMPWVGMLCCLTWLLVALAFRYSSLAALVSVAAAPFYAWLLPWGFRLEEAFAPGFGELLFRGERQFIEVSAAIAVIVWLRHHQNIRRLLSGQESKIGQKKKEAGAA